MPVIESQYQFPEQAVSQVSGPEDTPKEYSQQEHAEFLAIAEHAGAEYTPEMHEALRQREIRLDWYRYEAVNAPLPMKSKWGRLLESLGVNKQAAPTLPELVDQESVVGGELYQIPARFWLQPPVEHEHTRDWFFTFTHGAQEHTIHYQTDEKNIHKIYNGREYPFTNEEELRFNDATIAYEKNVVAKVYKREPVVQNH